VHPVTDVPVKPFSALPLPRPAKAAKPKPPAAQPAQAAPAPPAEPPVDGTVTLGIAPWGEIIVDGSSHGVSPPLTHLALAPGVHTIEVRNGAAPPYVSRIELQPGQAVEVQHRF
jgi:hypothetical protein